MRSQARGHLEPNRDLRLGHAADADLGAVREQQLKQNVRDAIDVHGQDL
ncbi:hypothetical protein [Nocardia sp. NPDC019395]